MAKSSSVSSSISSASKAASVSLSRGASDASSSIASASAKASAAAADAYNNTSSTTMIVITTLAIFITALAGVLAAIYYSGYADDIAEWWAKKYYAAKAKAEATALANVGSERAQGYLKDQLKKNPMLGEDELENISGGLGKDAASEGLAGVSGKLGGLGKF